MTDTANGMDDRIPTFEDDTAEDWTIKQSALLDAVREVAVSDADGAMHAARQLVRLLCLELGHPEPVEREGGLLGVLYGNPPKPTPRPEPADADHLPPSAISAYRAGEPIRVARPIHDTPQA